MDVTNALPAIAGAVGAAMVRATAAFMPLVASIPASATLARIVAARRESVIAMDARWARSVITRTRRNRSKREESSGSVMMASFEKTRDTLGKIFDVTESSSHRLT